MCVYPTFISSSFPFERIKQQHSAGTAQCSLGSLHSTNFDVCDKFYPLAGAGDKRPAKTAVVAQPPAKKAKSEPKKVAPPAKKEEEKVVSATHDRGCHFFFLVFFCRIRKFI